jgi:hypothetical protein
MLVCRAVDSNSAESELFEFHIDHNPIDLSVYLLLAGDRKPHQFINGLDGHLDHYHNHHHDFDDADAYHH